jgi:hypothetical protein
MEEKRSSVSLCEKQNVTIHFAALNLIIEEKLKSKSHGLKLQVLGQNYLI